MGKQSQKSKRTTDLHLLRLVLSGKCRVFAAPMLTRAANGRGLPTAMRLDVAEVADDWKWILP